MRLKTGCADDWRIFRLTREKKKWKTENTYVDYGVSNEENKVYGISSIKIKKPMQFYFVENRSSYRPKRKSQDNIKMDFR